MMKFFVATFSPVFLLAGGTHTFGFAPITTASIRASRVLSVATAPHRTIFDDATALFADKSDMSPCQWVSLTVVDGAGIGAEIGEGLAKGLREFGKDSPDLLSNAGSKDFGSKGLGKVGLGLGLGFGLIGVGLCLGSISDLVTVSQKHKVATRAVCKGVGVGLGVVVLAAVAIRLVFIYSPWFRHFWGYEPDKAKQSE